MKAALIVLVVLLASPIRAALAAPGDIRGHCQGRSQGSYQLEAYCVEQETTAQREMSARTVEQRILDYCNRRSNTWQLLKYCVDQEEQAKAKLGR